MLRCSQPQAWCALVFLLIATTVAPLAGGFAAVVAVNVLVSLLVLLGVVRLVLCKRPTKHEIIKKAAASKTEASTTGTTMTPLNKANNNKKKDETKGKKRAYWIDRMKVCKRNDVRRERGGGKSFQSDVAY